MEVFGKFFTCQIESKVKKFFTLKHKMHNLINTRNTFSHSPVLMENVLSWIYIFPLFSAIVAILIVLTMGCMSSFTFVNIKSIWNYFKLQCVSFSDGGQLVIC